MATNTLTTSNTYQTVLTVDTAQAPNIPSNAYVLSLFEGNLSGDGETLSGVNDIIFKVESAPVDAEALYSTLFAEETLESGEKTFVYVDVQERFIRIQAKSAVADNHGKVTVITN